MVCCDFISWSVFLVTIYLIVRKIISLLRVDRYTNLYILITGCDTGFGNETAKRLDRLGCHVFAGCLTEKGKEELKASCTERLHAISLDVSKIDSIKEAFEYVQKNLPKGKGLWGVLNNAGVSSKIGPLEWLSISDYKQVLDINLYGMINVTMTFLPLVKKERGRIVNTSSIAGRYATGTPSAPYNISKYMVEAFTDGLRRSLLPFRCKAVLIEPGAHKTHLCSSQNASNWVKAAWNEASPEAKAEYGEAFVHKYIETMDELINKLDSDKIHDVVDAYEKALLGRFPQARYLVGKERFFFVTLQAMPEWLGDRIDKILGMNLKPAALQ